MHAFFESWSEGSHSDAQTFKLDRAGRYRLLLLAQTGTGDQPVNTSNGPTLHIRVREGAQLKRFYATGMVLCGLAAVVGLIWRGAFESSRWGDDDDD